MITYIDKLNDLSVANVAGVELSLQTSAIKYIGVARRLKILPVSIGKGRLLYYIVGAISP